MSQPTPVLYELKSTNGLALSPWCWHARMALAHKGIEAELVPLGFTEKDPIIALGGKSFPLMQEADGTVHNDSYKIIMRLEELQPKPTLFPGGETGLALYKFLYRYTQTILFPTLIKIVLADIPSLLDGADRAYFIESREARFGMPLDQVCADRDGARATLSTQLDPFRRAMADGGYISGSAPAMADYLLFGVLQWARVVSAERTTEADDAIALWMENMLDLFDGLGRTVPARAG